MNVHQTIKTSKSRQSWVTVTAELRILWNSCTSNLEFFFFWLSRIKHSRLVCVVLFTLKGKMGVLLSNTYKTYWKSPDTAPDLFSDPSFSHDYGFSGERKKRSTYLIGHTKCRQIPTKSRPEPRQILTNRVMYSNGYAATSVLGHCGVWPLRSWHRSVHTFSSLGILVLGHFSFKDRTGLATLLFRKP